MINTERRNDEKEKNHLEFIFSLLFRYDIEHTQTNVRNRFRLWIFVRDLRYSMRCCCCLGCGPRVPTRPTSSLDGNNNNGDDLGPLAVISAHIGKIDKQFHINSFSNRNYCGFGRCHRNRLYKNKWNSIRMLEAIMSTNHFPIGTLFYRKSCSFTCSFPNGHAQPFCKRIPNENKMFSFVFYLCYCFDSFESQNCMDKIKWKIYLCIFRSPNCCNANICAVQFQAYSKSSLGALSLVSDLLLPVART